MTATYWDPIPAAHELSFWSGGADSKTASLNDWAERNPLNVPGPLYTTTVEPGGAGPNIAPNNVIYDDGGQEFVYRQPHGRSEVKSICEASNLESFGGYRMNGDRYWDVVSIREWWANRALVVECADAVADGLKYEPSTGFDHGVLWGLRKYLEYIDSGLADDLRNYMFWLEEGRSPRESEIRPNL